MTRTARQLATTLTLLATLAATLTVGLTLTWAAPPPGKGGGNGGGGGGGNNGGGGGVTVFPVPYQMRLLGTLGGDSSTANGMNNHGDVVGFSKVVLPSGYPPQHGFLNVADSGDRIMIDLNDLFIEEGLLAEEGPYRPFDAELLDGSFVANGIDINDAGQIVVDMTHFENGMSQGRECFRYTPSYEDPSGTLVPAQLDAFGFLPDGSVFSPRAINNNGDVAGSVTVDAYERLAVWTESGGLADLGQFEGRTTLGYDINDNGQFCGVTSSYYRAWRYTPGVGFEDLGVGYNKKYASSGAHSINNAGQVAGRSSDGQWKSQAFRFTDDDGLVNLGTLGGDSSTVNGPGAMNDLGDVVGVGETADGTTHIFLYTDDFGMADLEAAVVDLPADLAGGFWRASLHVNNQGVVCGRAGDGSGSEPSLGGHRYEAFILEPVPSD